MFISYKHVENLQKATTRNDFVNSNIMTKHRQHLSPNSKYHFFLFFFNFLLFLPYTILSQCPGTSCTYTITGSDSGTYVLNVGEKICFDPGANFTGTIDLDGGELINCATSPQTFSFASGALGFINNYGTLDFPANHSFTNGLTVNNYLNLNFSGDLTVLSGSTFNNLGLTTIDGQLLNTSQLDNSGTITIIGPLAENASATLSNSGSITTSEWTVNGTWTNSGTIDISGDFMHGNGKIGTINGGCLSSDTWTVGGTIIGTTCSDINISGTSTLTSNGSLLGDIAIIDATPPGSAPFIDIPNGTIGLNIVWTSCNACGTAEEICNNTIDDNGDGRIDEPYPGGVQTNMQLWLKAETGTNTTVDGNYVISWGDQSINGYSADADVNSVDDPIYSDNAINFNSGVVFDGDVTSDFSDGLHLGSDYIFSNNLEMNVFAVIDPENDNEKDNFIVDFGRYDAAGYGVSFSNSHYGLYTSGTRIDQSHSNGGEAALINVNVDFGNEQTIYRNGSILFSSQILSLNELDANNINESSNYQTNSTSGPFSIGRVASTNGIQNDGGRIFNGAISEIIVFNDSLSLDERKRINSYLALKYGLTLNHEYLASSGTTIKQLPDGYENNIVGIGRDDCASLNQKQSKSIEDEGVVTLSLGAIAATNQNNAKIFSADESFLIVGNDGQTVDTWSPVGGMSSDSRINRTWKIDNTNISQNITFTIDMDDPENDIAALTPGALSDYKIMFDLDGDFSNSGSLTTALTNTSGSLYEITLTPGSWQYFTIVHEPLVVVDEICNNLIDDNGDGRIDEVFPGGVQQDMQLWLKAETGTNTTVDGNDVTAWGDQSINGYSANADVNSTDDPTFSENAINFNPGIEFDGVYTDGFSDGLHLGSDYIYGEKDGVHIFVVCDPDVVAGTDKYVFDFGLQANGGYGMIYSDNDYGMYTENFSGGTNTELFHSEGDAPALVEMKVDFDDSQAFYRNGDLLSPPVAVTIPDLDETKVNEAPAYGALGTSSGPVSIGRKSASAFLDQDGGRIFDGRISEVIVFTDTLSSLEKQHVNSYLAIKYGLTITQDYLSSAGSIKKDISDGYANDIAGIGRDNCSGLHQKQSKSVNSEAIVTIGQGTIATTNELNANSISADGTYLVWGNNGAVANASWVDPNVTISGVDLASIDRTWKLSEHFDITNTLFQIEVDNPNFDLPAMPPAADGTYYLLRDDDGDFTNGGTTYEPMSLVAGDVWEVNIADPTNEYFTIAVGNTCGAMAPVLSK